MRQRLNPKAQLLSSVRLFFFYEIKESRLVYFDAFSPDSTLCDRMVGWFSL